MKHSEYANCKYCGESFKKNTKHHVYCSIACKEAYRLAQKPRFTGICPVCGKSFEYIINGKAPHKKYCSTSCQVKATVPEKDLVCIDCGATFHFRGRTTKLRCPTCWKKHRSDMTMKYRYEKDHSVQIGVGSGGWQNNNPDMNTAEIRELKLALRRERYSIRSSTLEHQPVISIVRY